MPVSMRDLDDRSLPRSYGQGAGQRHDDLAEPGTHPLGDQACFHGHFAHYQPGYHEEEGLGL